MMQSQLHELTLQAALKAYPEAELPPFTITHPEDEEHGDYSANIALILAKQVGESPRAVAEKVIEKLDSVEIVERIEIAGPGFINFYLKPEFFWSHVQQAFEQLDGYGKTDQGTGKTVMFEYGQPNTHKVAHIGHLYSYCYGESCSRLLESQGYTVIRANYQGDAGPHVAKCLWAYLKHNQADPETLGEKVTYLQQCYQEGSGAYDSDPEAKREIDALNRGIYQKDPEIMPIWEKTRQWSLDAYNDFEGRLGIAYNRHFLESEVYTLGQKTVRDNVGKIFEEDQGAIIFRGENYGLHTRVFINQHGNPTYEAKDIGLIQKKREEFDFDLAVIETGNDQKEYWRVVKQAMELLFPELIGKIATLHHGMVNLSTGKMSSRTGQILSAFSLVEMVKEQISAFIKESRDYPEAEREAIAELVAVGAIKYSFLRSAAGKDIMFDVESSLSFEGNSGPYLQYAFARCRSVLAKANFTDESINVLGDLPVSELKSEELQVLRYLYRFGEVVGQAASNYAPHMVAGFLFELASRYSLFYGQHQIITDDAKTTEFRLALTAATAQVLKNGLHLLGIGVADRI